MSQTVTVESNRSFLSSLGKFPWTILLIAYLLVVELMGLDMSGTLGYIFIGLGVFVLFAEFFKSGDVSAAAFFVDIVSAVAAVVVSTALLTWMVLVTGEAPTFFHWIGYAIILGDAVISPFNSFRTALRNFGVGV